MKLTAQREVTAWQGQQAHAKHDDLAVEEPLEIRAAGKTVCVVMRTPGHDQELAAGLLYTEGIVKTPSHLSSLRPLMRKEGCNAINAVFRRAAGPIPGRSLLVSSSCGLCGKTSIEAVHQHFPPIELAQEVPISVVLSLPAKLRAQQVVFERSGGLHAAALFDLAGNLIVLREDVGRHNAVDKVVGHALLARLLPLEAHILLVSGRASFEIIQKALAARIPVVAAVSAPSSLAAEFAEESGQTLAGFVRDGRCNIYSHPGRIRPA